MTSPLATSVASSAQMSGVSACSWAYNLSSGYPTSAREQLMTLYRRRPDAAQVNLDPETLRAEPAPPSGFSADLVSRDTGWRPQYTCEEALEDYLKWLGEHPY